MKKVIFKAIAATILLATSAQAELVFPRSSMTNAVIGALKNYCGSIEGSREHFAVALTTMINSGIDEQLATDVLKGWHLQFAADLVENPDPERCAHIDYHVARIIARDDSIESE